MRIAHVASIWIFYFLLNFQQQQLAVAQNLSNLANMQSLLPEAALADYAYNQAIFQLLHRNPSAAALTAAQNSLASANTTAAVNVNAQILNPNGNGISPVPSGANSTSAAAGTVANAAAAGLESDFGLNPDSFEPPIETDLYPTTLYSCLICANFNTNQIDELNQHLLIDRSRTSAAQNQQDVMLIINNNYICRLCNYKTTLKANFQLHSKTDKHIQKLNYINHIKEGGASNEYKLKYNSNNTVQLKCNCCDYYTNSIQKLNLHSQNIRHESMKIIFNHLVCTMATTPSPLNPLCNDNDATSATTTTTTTKQHETPKANLNNENKSSLSSADDALDLANERVSDASAEHMETEDADAVPNSEQQEDDEQNNGVENASNQTIGVKCADELNNAAKDSSAPTTTTTLSISVKNTDELIDASTKENNDTTTNNARQSPAAATNNNSDNNNKLIVCQLCNYRANHILGMVQHVKSFQHMQIEHLICMQRAKENLDSLELTDVFTVAESGK